MPKCDEFESSNPVEYLKWPMQDYGFKSRNENISLFSAKGAQRLYAGTSNNLEQVFSPVCLCRCDLCSAQNRILLQVVFLVLHQWRCCKKSPLQQPCTLSEVEGEAKIKHFAISLLLKSSGILRVWLDIAQYNCVGCSSSVTHVNLQSTQKCPFRTLSPTHWSIMYPNVVRYNLVLVLWENVCLTPIKQSLQVEWKSYPSYVYVPKWRQNICVGLKLSPSIINSSR